MGLRKTFIYKNCVVDKKLYIIYNIIIYYILYTHITYIYYKILIYCIVTLVDICNNIIRLKLVDCLN